MLNDLWEGIVEKYVFDVMKHTVSFHLRITEAGVVSHHNLEFQGVVAFYFVTGFEDKRFAHLWEPEEGDVLELTTIRHIDEGVGELTTAELAPNWQPYPSIPNFALEIWEAMLFLEARSVVVDGTSYEVGYPQKPLGSRPI